MFQLLVRDYGHYEWSELYSKETTSTSKRIFN